MTNMYDPLITNSRPTIPVVLNLPHSSSSIPSQVRDQFCVSDAELADEQRKLVDWFVDDLYSPIVTAGACAVRYNVSRFVCDPERFEDDEKECMFARGMGAIYSHGTERQRIRRDITPQERESILNNFYRPYHAALTEQVRHVVEVFGRCILIDCHSYQEHALPYELYGDLPRPDVVLGDDSIHTPAWISEEIARLTKEAGYSYGLNGPFAGTIVPLEFYGDQRVSSFMLEINRRTYMNEVTTKPHEGFASMQRLMGAIGEQLALKVSDTRTSYSGMRDSGILS